MDSPRTYRWRRNPGANLAKTLDFSKENEKRAKKQANERPENSETMASGATPATDAGGPHQLRKHLQGTEGLIPLLLTEHLSPAAPLLDTSGCSEEEGAEKTIKRKRQLVLGSQQGEGDEPSMASASSAESETSVINAGPKRSFDQPTGGLLSPPDPDDTLVIRKKWKREMCASGESPGLQCWSAEEHVRMRKEQLEVSKPLRRSMSTLDMLATAPKRPSLERRQLSAAAIDAVAASAHVLALPTIPSKDHPDLNVISPETVQQVLSGEFVARLASVELIDCRFPYEHQGGSLRGSRSLSDPASVEAVFMARPSPDSTRVALIFFCEFSANRAPKMCVVMLSVWW
jgi:hypothetical protein